MYLSVTPMDKSIVLIFDVRKWIYTFLTMLIYGFSWFQVWLCQHCLFFMKWSPIYSSFLIYFNIWLFWVRAMLRLKLFTFFDAISLLWFLNFGVYEMSDTFFITFHQKFIKTKLFHPKSICINVHLLRFDKNYIEWFSSINDNWSLLSYSRNVTNYKYFHLFAYSIQWIKTRNFLVNPWYDF